MQDKNDYKHEKLTLVSNACLSAAAAIFCGNRMNQHASTYAFNRESVHSDYYCGNEIDFEYY